MKATEPYQFSKMGTTRPPIYSLSYANVEQQKILISPTKHFQYATFKKPQGASPQNHFSPKPYYQDKLNNSIKFAKNQKKPNFARRNSSALENQKPSLSFLIERPTTVKNITAKNSPTHAKRYETMKNIDNVCSQERRKNFFQSINQSKIVSNNEKVGMRKIRGDNFDIIKVLGKGKYGKVFMVREKASGFLMALKVVQKKLILQNDLLDQLIRQIKIQFYLDHPGIVKLYGLFQDQRNLYLLMQLGCDGELYHYTSNGRTFSESSASYIAKNLLETIKYIHSKKIMHRDIKPENIVVIMGKVKICDFGWAVNNSFSMRSTFCGTPLYFSPELLESRAYDQKVDLWAIGVIIFELVFGKSPFNLEQPDDLPNIVKNVIDFPATPKITSEFRQFVQKILQKDPKKREKAANLLCSKFIKKYEDIQICEELCKKMKK